MTLATGMSGGCNFQHAAEKSSVRMIWAPGRFGASHTAGSKVQDRLQAAHDFLPLCGEPGAANQLGIN